MPTRHRCFVEGLSQHVIQRGTNRMNIFLTDSDYETFGLLLGRAAAKHGGALNGHVFMTNHVHLVVTPESEHSIARMMHAVEWKYALYFNERYERTGRLWEGPYRASLIESERYWYTCLRYVEQNPWRAKMIPRPGDYRWSSYRSHAFGEVNPLVMAHPLYSGLGTTAEQCQEAWRNICAEPLPEDQLATIRHAVHRGLTIGDHVLGHEQARLARIICVS
jgi:putative transposase